MLIAEARKYEPKSSGVVSKRVTARPQWPGILHVDAAMLAYSGTRVIMARADAYYGILG